jgi:hypothetical protein
MAELAGEVTVEPQLGELLSSSKTKLAGSVAAEPVEDATGKLARADETVADLAGVETGAAGQAGEVMVESPLGELRSSKRRSARAGEVLAEPEGAGEARARLA